MTALDIIFFLFVEPLKLLFEVIFFYAYKFTGNAGLSILIMSLAVNFLLLPLYFRADKLEKQQRAKKASMKYWTDFIKQKFKGDEKVMMLQAYYKEKDYRSTDVLKESVSLFLQIPFFIAAYSFLSGLKILHGISLGPIPDLGSPDALIRIGALSINLLPVLMTVINIISGFIYSEKGNAKDKIKLILIALVFLVLLYDSPAGLVFYWTLNNIFSLCKNAVTSFGKKEIKEVKDKGSALKSPRNTPAILLPCTVLAVLTGIMIPSGIISQNPEEFANTYAEFPHSPALYILTSALTAAGLFLIWGPLFIFLAGLGRKKATAALLNAAAVAGIMNYILFNRNFGLLSKKLIYEYNMSFAVSDTAVNLLANTAVFLVIILIAKKHKMILRYVTTISVIAVLFLSVMYCTVVTIYANGNPGAFKRPDSDIMVPMTTTGQNVVVIMMDRMLGAYIPYIFNERPDVASQFDGFTYYPNTVSLGKHTNFATPSLFGGYDYTPAKINARADESLVSKQNEALLVLPVLFAGNGWTVTVGDPPYANYHWIPDTSIYDGYDNITAYRLSGAFNARSELLVNAGEEYETMLNRNLFCFGFMKSLPLILQPAAYSDGTYNDMNSGSNGYIYTSYSGITPHTQYGINETHVQELTVLQSLNDIVSAGPGNGNCFFMFSNCATHDICLLQEPEYMPAAVIDNTAYDEAHEDRFTVNGVTMSMDSDYLDYASYECNMETCICLGNWFDYLRANNIYDNTRIILVADHGSNHMQFEEMLLNDPPFDVQSVNPVLMIKDFNASGFTTSYDFMTNADTPALAVRGIIDDAVNPFTGNPLISDDRPEEQIIYISERHNIYTNNGNQFEDPNGYFLSVHDNIFEEENWSIYDGA